MTTKLHAITPSHRNYVSTAGQWTEGMMLTGSAKP
ncbi:MAG: hypothetical protein ACI9ND_002018 [Yoonia sp.]|jgi:hypothetical protein